MADKIVVMNSGNVEQTGPPLELYDRPANLFVAGFIGSPAMNLLKGKHRRRRLPWPRAARSCRCHGRRPTAGPAIYGIRPEHFQLEPG